MKPLMQAGLSDIFFTSRVPGRVQPRPRHHESGPGHVPASPAPLTPSALLTVPQWLATKSPTIRRPPTIYWANTIVPKHLHVVDLTHRGEDEDD
jgi:hypothetical protein